MSTKKNIDKLFQEHFNEHEVLPPDIVWKNIEAHLKEKQKRKVIPFWFKLSGIAALLVIGLGLYNWQFNEIKPTKTDEVIVNKNKPNSENSNKNTISVSDAVINNEDINSSKNEITGSEITVTDGDSSVETSDNNTLYPKENSTKKPILKRNLNPKFSTDSKNNIAKTNTSSTKKSSVKTSNSDTESNTKESINKLEKVTNSVADNTKKQLLTDDKSAANSIVRNNKTEIEKSIIENTLEEINKIDSTKVANVEPNALERKESYQERTEIK